MALENFSTIPTTIAEIFEFVSSNKFELLAIPVILFFIGVGCKTIVKIRVLTGQDVNAKRVAYFEIIQTGPEFCLISVGVVWAASYRISSLHIQPPLIVAIVVAVGSLLVFCCLVKGLLRNLWIKVIVSDLIGFSSVGLCFLGVKMLGVA